MTLAEGNWQMTWFNENYLKLYADRNQEEAEKQVEALSKLLNLTGKENILDLGCGNGRHALAFSTRGHRVVGIDTASILLDKAKEKAEKLDNPPLFIEEELREIKNLGSFDLIVSLFTSFGYFEEDLENKKILMRAKEHLHPNGSYLLDFLNPTEVVNNLLPYEEKIVENNVVKIRKKIENNMIIKEIEFPDEKYTERVKLYKKNQIEALLSEAGFTIKAVYSDFSGNTWAENGKRQIFLSALKH